MTGRVVSARRLGALSGLGAALADATHRDAVFDALRATVAALPEDLPFAVVPGDASGLEAAIAAAPSLPAEIVLADGIAAGVWPEPVTRVFAAELPSGSAAARHTIAFGLSPRLPFDDGYRRFLQQIVDQASAALRRIDNAAASRATEEQRDNLLMHAPVAAALLTGPTHVCQLANPLYCVLGGRDPTGQAFADAFPEIAGHELHQHLDRVYRTGEPYSASEQRIPLDRGAGLEDAYFNFHVEPLRGPTGDVHGLMVVAVEITEQVRASRAKDEFLAMLGHELRNPLAPIAAAVELMKRKETATSREQETIERQLQHVTRLVDDLLDVSRITRGTIELERRTLELGAVIARAIEIAQPLIEQRGHRLVVDVRTGLFVDGDEARLTQVVVNLLTNAARYTADGGELRVLAGVVDGDAVVRVIDNGIGMDAELLEHVFELFVQGKRSPDRVEGGLGIGLALVKNLVTLHDGTVTARSDGRGHGSEIVVTLPLRAGPSPQPGAAPVAGLPFARVSRRVVIVDDNEDAAMLLGELVRTCGHEVEIAHDPHDALRVIGEFAPHVAVLDIGLPGMDGYDLAARIRLIDANCRLIALTGYGQEKDRARAAEAGFEAHFVKPVALNAFLAALS
jgi:signal transduction histidine kinase/CheY-like chemotaxis protein